MQDLQLPYWCHRVYSPQYSRVLSCFPYYGTWIVINVEQKSVYTVFRLLQNFETLSNNCIEVDSFCYLIVKTFYCKTYYFVFHLWRNYKLFPLLTPMGNIENLVSSFSADFSHMIDLTDFVIIANESRGLNLAIESGQWKIFCYQWTAWASSSKITFRNRPLKRRFTHGS